ncbi:hypothetical protein LCGC14_0959940 [marine sediment metagenome]|uniref:DUF4145 domain-containing protein n=1 Tax=marine sediment metagenome TaxID=412755 RepID=A0A0F9NER6_9ZZZZ
MLLGEDNIYDIINRVMQIDGYNSQNGLFISILLPIYVRIKDLNYEKGVLSGKVEFHKIFSGSKIFFRIFSKPNCENESLCGTEEFLIDIEHKETDITSHDYHEIPISLDFKKYDCDPNFEIRVLWDKFYESFLIDFQKSFGSPRYIKQFEDLKIELSEKNQDVESTNLKYQNLIDLDISLDNDYRKIITDINNAYTKGFYDCVYILVRKLIENLLIDCLRKFYKMEKIGKFYDQDRGIFLPFTKLKLNFSIMINDDEFKAAVGKMQQVLIDYFEIFKETGNASAHSFFSINHSYIIEENRDKLMILVDQLARIYRKLSKMDN